MTEEKEKTREQAADLRRLLPALCNTIWLILTVAVIFLCLPFALPGIWGLQPYTIVSGSMEPELPVGSLVYVEPLETDGGRGETPGSAGNLAEEEAPADFGVLWAGSLRPGDIITFYGGGPEAGVITHRVVENRKAERELITKGDANEAADPRPVSYNQVIGRVKSHVPCLGWLYPLMSGQAGKLRLLGLLLAAVLFRLAGRRIERKDRE